MAIKVIIAKAHQAQLEDADIKRELGSVEDELNRVELLYKKDTVNFVFVKGTYFHSERKMLTACLFVNKMDEPITEIHGVLRMKFQNRNALIAKTTVDFDQSFMGSLNPDEALLVHIGIPVKGLSGDENFIISDVAGSFDDVRVTMN